MSASAAAAMAAEKAEAKAAKDEKKKAEDETAAVKEEAKEEIVLKPGEELFHVVSSCLLCFAGMPSSRFMSLPPKSRRRAIY